MIADMNRLADLSARSRTCCSVRSSKAPITKRGTPAASRMMPALRRTQTVRPSRRRMRFSTTGGRSPALPQPGERRLVGGDVVRMGEHPEGAADEVLLRVARELAEGAVHDQVLAVERYQRQPDRGLVESLADEVELGLRLLARGASPGRARR